MSPVIILGMGSANERRRYIVTPSLLGWAHTQNPWPPLMYWRKLEIYFIFCHFSTLVWRRVVEFPPHRRSYIVTLQWRHNERDGVSNHQPHDCLLNRLFRRRSKKTSKLRFTGLCTGNSPITGEFPAQRASNAENVSIWWRLHDDVIGSHAIGPFHPEHSSTRSTKIVAPFSVHGYASAYNWDYYTHYSSLSLQVYVPTPLTYFRRKKRYFFLVNMHKVAHSGPIPTHYSTFTWLFLY